MKTNKIFLKMVLYGVAGLISMASVGAAREILKQLDRRVKKDEVDPDTD